MTGPEVTTDVDLRESLRYQAAVTVWGALVTGDATVTGGRVVDAIWPLIADALDKRTRVAASLEADLARILDAWDAWHGIEGRLTGGKAAPALRAAIAAAREWVGRDTG